MALFDKHTVNINSKILELINRRQRQILVHSYIYYKEDSNLVDDFTFDKWCKELFQLQTQNKKEFEKSVFHNVFKKWSGFSGYDLFKDELMVEMWARYKATQLILYKNAN